MQKIPNFAHSNGIFVRTHIQTRVGFKLEIQASQAKLEIICTFLQNNWARVEFMLFEFEFFFEFALEMLRASSSKCRDFRVLQSTSHARVRVATR